MTINVYKFDAIHGPGHQSKTDEIKLYEYDMEDEDEQCELEWWVNTNHLRNVKATMTKLDPIPLEVLDELIRKYKNRVINANRVVEKLSKIREKK